MFRILNLEFRYYLGFRILILGFIAACLGFVAFIPNAEAAIVIQAPKYIGLNSGLVGYWSFDGKDMANVTAYDRSGNANNGTLTNGPTRAIGKIGQGLSFDGSNDYVNVSDNANFDLGGKNFSISFWFKANEDLNTIGDIWSDRRSILQKGVDSIGLANGAYQIFFEGDVDTVLIEFSNGANWFNAQTAKTSWDANTWYHGVITHNQTTMSWYIDGILDSQTTRTETIQNNNDSLRIGRFDRNAWSWTGLIDDVRIYNRALSADEIKRLYRIGATLKINTSINNDSLANGLVGYWSMNAPDVAGTTAYDRSGNSKNGSTLGQDISAQGLVGWWKLDEGTGTAAGDSSGNGNTGTLAASPSTPTWTTSSKIGQGLSFDGSNDYVTMGNPSSLQLSGAISITAWVYLDAVAAQNGRIISKFVTGAKSYELSSDDNPGVGLLSMLVSGDGTATVEASESTTLPLKSWQFVTGVYVPSTSITVYRNGVQVGQNTTSIPASLANPATNFQIGDRTTTNYPWLGKIDDVRLYERALSAAEIAQLYSYGLPRFVPTAGKLGQGVDSTQSYVNPGNVSSSVNSFSLWMKTASSSPTVNLLDLNAGQSIKIVGGAVTASGLTSPSIFVDGASGSTVNAGWHHIAVTTGTAVNASAVNLGLNATTTAPLDGVLDDVRFYNRVINNNEIKRLYRIGATLKINTDVSRDNPDLERGLVGLWSFDGKDMAGNTAYDRSGQGNNGTLTNGPTRAIGKIGQGLSFDGSDDYVEKGDSASLDITGDISVSAWVKLNSFPAAASGYNFVAKYSANNQRSYLFQVFNDGSKSIFASGLSSAGTAQNDVLRSLVPLKIGTWYHFVFTRNKSAGSHSMYVNAVRDMDPANDGSMAAGTGIFNSTAVFNIGARDSGLDSFDGSIDDVRIYNRALSADEIKRLYNLGR